MLNIILIMKLNIKMTNASTKISNGYHRHQAYLHQQLFRHKYQAVRNKEVLESAVYLLLMDAHKAARIIKTHGIKLVKYLKGLPRKIYKETETDPAGSTFMIAVTAKSLS